MSRFEDNLWAQLEREHAPALLQNLATQRRRRTARWMGAAAGVAVLGGVAAATYSRRTPPAYAVVDNSDGSVTLTVREVQRFEEATAKLRERGVPAVAVPLRRDCVPQGQSVGEPLNAVKFDLTPEALQHQDPARPHSRRRHGRARDGQSAW